MALCGTSRTLKMEDGGLVMKDIKPTNILIKRLLKSEVIPAVDETDETDCDIETKDNNEPCEKEKANDHVQRKPPSPVESLRKLSKISHNHMDTNSFISIPSHQSSPNFRRNNSMRSLKNYHHLMSELIHNKPVGSDSGSHYICKVPQSDAASLRSWASVGMGSTDGKKMIVRRVPTSPVELFNIVNPPT